MLEALRHDQVLVPGPVQVATARRLMQYLGVNRRSRPLPKLLLLSIRQLQQGQTRLQQQLQLELLQAPSQAVRLLVDGLQSMLAGGRPRLLAPVASSRLLAVVE